MFAFSCCIGRALLLRPFRRLSLSIAVAFSLQAGGWALAGDLTPAIVSIPLPAFQGTEAGGMTTQVFLPEGKAPFPVVIFSHGRAPTAEGRANLKIPVLPGHVGYWQAKGFAVVAPIRPGYGATGGPDREASGVRWDQENRCGGKPDLPGALNRAAFAVRNAVDWARTQSWARNDRILLVGQSVGGMTSVVLGGQKIRRAWWASSISRAALQGIPRNHRVEAALSMTWGPSLGPRDKPPVCRASGFTRQTTCSGVRTCRGHGTRRSRRVVAHRASS